MCVCARVNHHPHSMCAYIRSQLLDYFTYTCTCNTHGRSQSWSTYCHNTTVRPTVSVSMCARVCVRVLREMEIIMIIGNIAKAGCGALARTARKVSDSRALICRLAVRCTQMGVCVCVVCWCRTGTGLEQSRQHMPDSATLISKIYVCQRNAQLIVFDYVAERDQSNTHTTTRQTPGGSRSYVEVR